jgi:putative transcriptional regulator
MQSELASDLTNHFLLAMPAMADPNFGGAVVFVAEHSAKGALGLVINRPMELDLQSLFERIDLKLEIAPLAKAPVFFGGPVQTDRGFVLHEPLGSWSSTVSIGDSIGLTSSKDVLEAVANGAGPQRLLVTLGYAGWGPGQLEDEIARNAWLTVEADPDLIFDVPVPERLNRAFGLLGVDPAFLSSAAGHA